MTDSKPFWQSKTIWAGLLTGLASIYSTIGVHHGWPAIPSWIGTILGAATIYGRVKADKTIA